MILLKRNEKRLQVVFLFPVSFFKTYYNLKNIFVNVSK